MACGECVIPPLGYPGCYPPAIPTDVGRRIVRVSVPGLQGPPGETARLATQLAPVHPSALSKRRRLKICDLKRVPSPEIRLQMIADNSF